jgi:hypothetical protein
MVTVRYCWLCYLLAECCGLLLKYGLLEKQFVVNDNLDSRRYAGRYGGHARHARRNGRRGGGMPAGMGGMMEMLMTDPELQEAMSSCLFRNYKW